MFKFTNRELEFAVNELGMSVSSFADYMHIDVQKVYKLMKENEIKANRKKCLFDKGVIYNIEELAEHFDMPLELVAEGYRQFNTRYKLITFEDAVRMVIKENKNPTQIAEELGCSRQNIHAILNKYGIYDMLPKAEDGRRSVSLLKIKQRSKDIEEMYLKGKSVYDISEEIGVSHIYIYKYLKDNFLYENRNNVEIDLEEFVDLYLQGFNCVEIAEEMGVNVNTLYNRLKTEGIKDYDFYKNMTVVELDRDTIYDMYVNKNMSVQKIADEVGLGVNTLYGYMVREGIFRRIKNFKYMEYVILKDLGYNDDEIADKFKINKETYEIAKIKNRDKIELISKIMELKNSGMSAYDIGVEMNMYYPNVLYYIREFNTRMKKYI